MKTHERVLAIISTVTIISLIVILLLAFLLFGYKSFVSYDIKEWDELETKETYLPSVNEMGEYSDLNYKCQTISAVFFVSKAYTLKATYNGGEEFEKQKDIINTEMVFQDKIIEITNKETIEKEASFEIDDFKFRMLSEEEYELDYPKEIVFVGISEEKKEIAFVVFSDPDLDYIDTFPEFLIKTCGWKLEHGQH